jgi:hypothetical protein
MARRHRPASHLHSGLGTDRCAGHSNAGYVRRPARRRRSTSISSNPHATTMASPRAVQA